MKNVMIVLAVSLIFCGMLTGCKKKSEEEKMGKLIERQEKKNKKEIKEIQVKLGKPFTVWEYFHNIRNMKDEKVTKFSITFENISVSPVRRVGAGTAFSITIKPSLGKEFLEVDFAAKNLGPRKGFFKIDYPEVKIDNGNIYKASDIVYRGGSGILENRAEQGETITGSIYFEIPKNRKPYEITGTIGERSYNVSSRFRLKVEPERIHKGSRIRGRSGISSEPVK